MVGSRGGGGGIKQVGVHGIKGWGDGGQEVVRLRGWGHGRWWGSR